MSLADYFDAVYFVNMANRPERLASFLSGLPKDWPFKPPERFEAVDGDRKPPPVGYRFGKSAWGCACSHYKLLATCHNTGKKRVLVLEDDAIFCEDFAGKIAIFLDSIPVAWDGLWLGGEHTKPPSPVSPGVVKSVNTIRTHGYAMQEPFLSLACQTIAKFKQLGHVDRILASIQENYNVYAPDPFLIGQAAGRSDVDGKLYDDIRWWN